MSSVLFFYFFGSLCLCAASFHSQYRVPQISTDRWESYEFNDQEYIIQKLPVKWEDAEIICRGHHNGSLAILDTAEKAEFLAEVLAETQLDVDTVWVGARRHSADDAVGYKWFGDVPLRRTAFDVLPLDSNDSPYKHYPSWLNRTHVPVPDAGADCVALDRVNHDHPVFLDLPCVLERPFACVRDSQHQVPVTELRLVRCKAGLYHVFNGRLNWDEAAAYCVMRKMTLANVASMKCLKKLGMTMLKTRPKHLGFIYDDRSVPPYLSILFLEETISSFIKLLVRSAELKFMLSGSEEKSVHIIWSWRVLNLLQFDNSRKRWELNRAYASEVSNIQLASRGQGPSQVIQLRPEGIETAWIGARGTAGKWNWMDNGLSIFLPSLLLDTDPSIWPPLRDRNSLKQNGCLQLDRHSSHPPVFLEGRCERKMQFICYENTFHGTSLRHMSTPPPSDDSYYYILVKQPMIWQNAFANCEKMNGSLAMLDSNEIIIELLLLMGENEKTPIDHIWVSGKLNLTKDPLTDANNYTWYNPVNGKPIPDKNSVNSNVVIPWLDEEYSSEVGCLNLDRQNHLGSLVYGLPCDTLQPSICMIEKNHYSHEAESQSVPKISEPVEISAQTTTAVTPPTVTAHDAKSFVQNAEKKEIPLPLSPPELPPAENMPAPQSEVAQDLAAEATNLQ